MREDLIPLIYYEKSNQKIQTANEKFLSVHYKIFEVHICVKKICIKTSFLLIKSLKQRVILGNPFITQIKPFIITNEGIFAFIKEKKNYV